MQTYEDINDLLDECNRASERLDSAGPNFGLDDNSFQRGESRSAQLLLDWRDRVEVVEEEIRALDERYRALLERNRVLEEENRFLRTRCINDTACHDPRGHQDVADYQTVNPSSSLSQRQRPLDDDELYRMSPTYPPHEALASEQPSALQDIGAVAYPGGSILGSTAVGHALPSVPTSESPRHGLERGSSSMSHQADLPSGKREVPGFDQGARKRSRIRGPTDAGRENPIAIGQSPGAVRGHDRDQASTAGSLPRPTGRGPRRPYDVPLPRAGKNQPVPPHWINNSTLPTELKAVINRARNKADLPAEKGICLIVAWVKKIGNSVARRRDGPACEVPCEFCADHGSVCVQVKDPMTVTILNSTSVLDSEKQKRCNQENEATDRLAASTASSVS